MIIIILSLVTCHSHLHCKFNNTLNVLYTCVSIWKPRVVLTTYMYGSVPSHLLKSGLADTVVNDSQPLFVCFQLTEHRGPTNTSTWQLVGHCTLWGLHVRNRRKNKNSLGWDCNKEGVTREGVEKVIRIPGVPPKVQHHGRTPWWKYAVKWCQRGWRCYSLPSSCQAERTSRKLGYQKLQKRGLGILLWCGYLAV